MLDGRNSGFGELERIIIPESVTHIRHNAFQECINLSSIKIPSSITTIGDYAFRDCRSLTSIEIPSSVTNIGRDVFLDWTSSQTINIKGYTSTPSDWSTDWNGGCSATINWNQ